MSAASVFALEDGRVQPGEGTPAFTLRAPAEVWAKFLAPVPPRHHHGVFAMLYRVPEFGIDGDLLCFMQHAHIARRVLEVGKWLALGNAAPVPVSLQPRTGERARPGGGGRLSAGDGARYDVTKCIPKRPAQAASCCACTPPVPTGGSSTA